MHCKPLKSIVLTVWLGTFLLFPVGAKQSSSSATNAADNLLEPTFTLKSGNRWGAGKAWCGKLKDGRVFVFTALHLFGPDAGLPQQLPADKLAGSLKQVDLVTCGKAQAQSTTTRVLSKTGFVLDERTMDFTGDVVILQTPANVGAKPFPLANRPATVGEPVWLYTRLAQPGSTAQLYPAAVTNSSARMLQVKLNTPLAIQATSGSPVIDKQGQVVGMLIAGNEGEGIVFCNPGSAIYNRVLKDVPK